MALVTSDKDMTVIILNNTEAEALANVFEEFGLIVWGKGEAGAWVGHELGELAYAMLSEKMAFAYGDEVEVE